MWLGETASMFDPLTWYLKLKDISLFNVPNLIPINLSREALLSENDTGKDFTVQFFRDERPSRQFPSDSLEVVGYNNLGQLSFLGPSTESQTRHTLYWHPHRQSEPLEGFLGNTQHLDST
ncbi:MAG: hypothetical protein AAFN18_19455 [Cyanobacteria bacterium J06554_6]